MPSWGYSDEYHDLLHRIGTRACWAQWRGPFGHLHYKWGYIWEPKVRAAVHCRLGRHRLVRHLKNVDIRNGKWGEPDTDRPPFCADCWKGENA